MGRDFWSGQVLRMGMKSHDSNGLESMTGEVPYNPMFPSLENKVPQNKTL